MAGRKMGVEEELVLVDPKTGVLRPASRGALAAHRDRVGDAADDDGFGADSGLDHELFLEQLEIGTEPCLTSSELMAGLVSCRRAAAESAQAAGAGLMAVGTPVMPADEESVTPKPRYERIRETFGEVSRQGSVSGMHVHVDVSDEHEAVRVVDGLRPWLPVLRAMSVNSPFWHGRDTGYASWRSQVWSRFPTAGPTEPFGNPAAYHAATQALVDGGAALDHAMIYFDARLSQHYPTVEVRVCDVMTERGDAVLLAVLTRALVETIARESAAEGWPVHPWRTELLRAAHWRASRYGLSSDLLDPRSGALGSARSVVETMVGYVGAALDDTDERSEVTRRIDELFARGTGAARQRAVAEASGGLDAVVVDLRERFAASWA